MDLVWRDNGIAHHAEGSNGFQYVIFTGWQNTLVKRVPATRRHSKTVVQREEHVTGVAAGRELAQRWEDEESS